MEAVESLVEGSAKSLLVEAVEPLVEGSAGSLLVEAMAVTEATSILAEGIFNGLISVTSSDVLVSILSFLEGMGL